MPNFRNDYASDWKMKTVDALGHVVLGTLLWFLFRKHYSPWVILLQWLPDMFLYPRWLYGMLTGKYLLKSNPLRSAHLLVHGPSGLIISLLCLLLPDPIVGLNMLSHLLWDQYTHRKLAPQYR